MKKKIVLIAYYGRVDIAILLLSAILKRNGHDCYVFYVKEDRSILIDKLDDNTKQFQFVSASHGGGLFGTGVDVNPLTSRELELLAGRIEDIAPDVVAVSSRSVHLDMTKEIFTELRKRLPSVRYIAGGYGPSLQPELFLEVCDYVCIGKGDQVVIDLVELDDPSSRPGVASIAEGKLNVVPPVDDCDLDARPDLDWGSENKFIVDDDQIYPLGDRFDSKNYVTITSEGCPSSCTYCQACQWPQIYKMHNGSAKKVRIKKPESVILELKHAVEKYGICDINFCDSIFTWNKKWLETFLDMYEREINLPFVCFVDSRFTSIEQMRLLKKHGLFGCSIGIQSADQNIRQAIMGRKESDDDLVAFAWEVERLGIKITYDIILWNPFETEETMRNGLSLLKRLPKSNRIILYELKMLPHSTLDIMYRKAGPEGLTMDRTVYWAWVYMLMLRSEAGEKIVWELIDDPEYVENPYKLRDVYLELLEASSDSEKLVANRDIKSGDILRPTMFIEKKSAVVNAVPAERRHAITGCLAVKDVLRGATLCFDDFIFPYGKK